MAINDYETSLTGGHPNSLGYTLQVVEDVLKDEKRLRKLFDCYKSDNEVVRLRVSNAVKRVTKENPDWVAKYLDEMINDISSIDQASTKWTLSTLFMWLDTYMTDIQRTRAIEIMKTNLYYDDWIVQNTTSESLAYFAKSDATLKKWLIPELTFLEKSRHKSVSKRAAKLKESLK